MKVSVRYVALAIGAALVLLLGVYLFIEVRATPARADGGSRHDDVRAAAAPDRAGDGPAADRDRPAPALASADGKPGPGAPVDPEAHRPTIHPLGGRLAPTGPAVQKFDTIAEARDAARDSAKDRANPKLEAVMLEANKAYDRGDIDEARELAKKVVSDDPANVRMLRVLVSTSCMDGDAATAKQYYATLPKPDQRQMQTRCSRYGVTFPDAPPVPPDPAP